MSWAALITGIVRFFNQFFERLQLNDQEELGRLRVENNALKQEVANLRAAIAALGVPNNPESDPNNRDNR